MRSNIAVWRLQLFKASETFITEQARCYRSLNPILYGRTQFGPAPHGLGFRLANARGRLDSLRFDLFSQDLGLAGEMHRDGIRLIHAHFAIDGLIALPLARRLGIPLVTTLHGFDVTMTRGALLRSLKPAWMRYGAGLRSLQRHGDLFLCVSEYIRERALSAGFPREKLLVHHIGTDIETFAGAARNASRSKGCRVLHVARLVEKKGTAHLLSAFHMAMRAGFRGDLMIIGEGPLRPALERQVAALGLGESVRFLGAQPYSVVKEHMAAASILALPSVTARSGDAEGLGMVLLEAAASGAAIIGTRHGGIPEVIRHEETGLLVGERDEVALAGALRRLHDYPELRAQLGAGALAHVRDCFHLQRQSEHLEGVFQSLIASRRGGG